MWQLLLIVCTCILLLCNATKMTKRQMCITSWSQKNADTTALHYINAPGHDGYLCVTQGVVWDRGSAWSKHPRVTCVTWPQSVWEEHGDSSRSFINRTGLDTKPINDKPATDSKWDNACRTLGHSSKNRIEQVNYTVYWAFHCRSCKALHFAILV